MGDGRSELLLTESLRQLDAQTSEIDQLRARASWMISAAAVSTSFLGGGLVRQTTIDALGWTALGFFVLSITCSLWVLASPMREVPSGFSPSTIYDDWFRRQSVSGDEARTNIAMRLEQALQNSRPKVDLRRNALTAGAVALTAEVVLWVIQLTN